MLYRNSRKDLMKEIALEEAQNALESVEFLSIVEAHGDKLTNSECENVLKLVQSAKISLDIEQD